MAKKVPKVKVRTTQKSAAPRHSKAAVVSDAPSFAAGGKSYVVISGEGALVSARTLQSRHA